MKTPLTSHPQCGQPGHCTVAQIFDADGKSIAAIDSTADPAEATAAAARLAACANALEGVSTEYLEKYGLPGFAAKISTLIEQRDQLLEALQDMLAVHGVTHEYVERRDLPHSWAELSDKARAAIAKATAIN